jgi:hypothetical protein
MDGRLLQLLRRDDEYVIGEIHFFAFSGDCEKLKGEADRPS